MKSEQKFVYFCGLWIWKEILYFGMIERVDKEGKMN